MSTKRATESEARAREEELRLKNQEVFLNFTFLMYLFILIFN